MWTDDKGAVIVCEATDCREPAILPAKFVCLDGTTSSQLAMICCGHAQEEILARRQKTPSYIGPITNGFFVINPKTSIPDGLEWRD